MKQNNKIIKFHKQIQFNIGIVIFGIILLYVLFHVFSYITSDSVTVYEVNEGSISENKNYRALAIRQEEVVNAEASGTIFYYASNLDQVGVRTNIYSIDNSGKITEKLKDSSSDESTITKDDLHRLETKIQEYIYEYDGNNFQNLYGFKTDLSSDLRQYYSNSMLNEMEGEISKAQQQGKFTYYQAKNPGTVVFQTDGMEGTTLDNYSEKSFDSKNVKITNLKSQDKLKEGQAVYKLVTSDHWNLIMQIDKEMAQKIKKEKTEYIQIRFLDDDATTWTSCSVEKKDSKYYLNLALDDSVERYANSRFVHIALVDDEISGLKIPNSAIVKKKFYTVPSEYFYQDKNSDAAGLMIKGSKGADNYVSVNIYYTKDNLYYISSEELTDDTIIIKPNSTDTYRLGDKTGTLQGVYNVNKGFAVFKQIQVLYKNEDYSIVKKGTEYGLANYDHIALQGNLIKENEMIN
ncbi:MAG: hypothetical protein MR010_04560 [Lachnospiraceae bacterium]|nr:hypothetical protein [Lachnospiraceae bacterium]